MSVPLQAIRALTRVGRCAYCNELAPMYEASFAEAFTLPNRPPLTILKDVICAMCASHLNDDDIKTPAHPLEQMEAN